MALSELRLSPREGRLPPDVRQFLTESQLRIRSFIENRTVRISGFVPSDFEPVWYTLRTLAENDLCPGLAFCEWGSGFGVVAMLAALLEFDACGIEIEHSLVEASRDLAADFSLSVDFVCGSFIPEGGERIVAELCSGEDAWLTPVTDDAYRQLGMDVRDFDVIYAFPWPGEEQVIAELFDEFAAAGAILLTFDHMGGVRVRRKVMRFGRR
ncbi:MAG: hypothetical protein KDA89_15735 [Planctomycetaceae bacterium]|nr:hypothetical protein [Planctomycetaceae bacterium]